MPLIELSDLEMNGLVKNYASGKFVWILFGPQMWLKF